MGCLVSVVLIGIQESRQSSREGNGIQGMGHIPLLLLGVLPREVGRERLWGKKGLSGVTGVG